MSIRKSETFEKMTPSSGRKIFPGRKDTEGVSGMKQSIFMKLALRNFFAFSLILAGPLCGQYYKTIFAIIELPSNYSKILMHYFSH